MVGGGVDMGHTVGPRRSAHPPPPSDVRLKKILLAPLRLVVGWDLTPRWISVLAVAMIVLLRLTIGWHFFSEGAEKAAQGDWTATPFFANAQGPFAGQFRQLVWDYDGSVRLDQSKTLRHWAIFRDRVGKHYGFDKNQQAKAQLNFGRAAKQLNYVLTDDPDGTGKSLKQEVIEYRLGLLRIAELEKDPIRDGVASLGGQRDTIRKELSGTIAPVLASVDQIWRNYERAQQQLATAEQLRARGPYRMNKPRVALMDTSVIDRIVPYFDLCVGWCLLLGLFTPVAALAAAGFLGSVFLSQYPPATGPTSSNYQLIECMACLVLAATGAGRFAGLDFFIHLLIRKVVGPARVRTIAT